MSETRLEAASLLGWDPESPLAPEEWAEALEQSAAVRDPRRVPGQTRVHFSPMRLLALTEVPRDDVDTTDLDLFLTEEPLETVAKNGIMIGGERFSSSDLRPYTTGDKSGPQRDLVIRYDRSRFARGTLDEVRVLERVTGGRYELRAVCRLREIEDAGVDPDAVIRETHRYEEQLLAKRSMAESSYVALVAGTRAAEEQVRNAASRARFAKSVRPEPMVATPIVAELTDPAAVRMGKRLSQGSAPGAPARAQARSRRVGSAKQAAPTAMADAPTAAAAPRPGRRGAGGLGSRLGGKTGFGKP